MVRKRVVRRPKKLTAWQQSARFRQIGSAAITAWNLARNERPQCSATARGTGERCGQSAMANGVCYYHGGRTPKGEAWHKPRWPDANSADAEAKLARKLRDREKASRRRARRLARMTFDEREKHAQWQRAHKPGSAKKRAAEKELRRQNTEAAKSFESQHAVVNPAVAELQSLIDELERRVAVTNIDIFS